MAIIRPTGKFQGDAAIDAERLHLEPAEVTRLFKVLAPNPFWCAYFRLQFYYGCRMSEVSIILKEDIHWPTQRIMIRRLKKKQFEARLTKQEKERMRGKTRDEQRRIKDSAAQVKVSDGFDSYVYQLPTSLQALLKPVVTTSDKGNPWLFGSPSNRPVGKDRMAAIRVTDGGRRAVSRAQVHERFKDACLLADIPAHLSHTHVLRHTRATLMLASGASEQAVMYLLGHSSVDITRRYLGVAESLKMRVQTEAHLGLGDLAEFSNG